MCQADHDDSMMVFKCTETIKSAYGTHMNCFAAQQGSLHKEELIAPKTSIAIIVHSRLMRTCDRERPSSSIDICPPSVKQTAK